MSWRDLSPWRCVSTSNHAHDYRLLAMDGSPLPVRAPCNDHMEQRAVARFLEQAPDLADVLERIVRTAYEDRGSDDAYHGDDFDPLFREAAALLGLDLDELADVEPDDDEDDDEGPPPSTADTCDEPDPKTCHGCGRTWCERCDPTPGPGCPWCNGRGYSTAEVRP